MSDKKQTSVRMSLAMIVKADDAEAELLKRCLSYVASFVDEICITITGENKKCEEVAKSYGAKISHFKWINDFAAARNFNFSQATGKYILWLDADDILRGGELLQAYIDRMEKEKIDTLIMNYLYDFDKFGQCVVKHLKTRVVRKDAVKWLGELHEDFEELRTLDAYMVKDVEVLHITTEKRAEDAAKRNTEIAKAAKSKKPDDPRSDWLVANALMGEGKYEEARKEYLNFIKKSKSEEEKYLAYLNLAQISRDEDYALKAVGLRPSYPNAYFKIAEILFDKQQYDRSQVFIEIGLQMPKPETSIIVYNPRDYDFNPMMLLMKVHYQKGNIQKSIQIIKKLMEWYPKDENLKGRWKLLEEELGEILEADKWLEKAQKIKDKKKLEEFLDSLPQKLKDHPKVCYFRNLHFIKEKSSGRDLVYYCSYTSKIWNPEVAKKKGVGGSEEAVINVSKELAKHGWNVTVYNNCGEEKIYDGVQYRHYWKYNIRDNQDVTILWRHPKPADFEINSKYVVVDLHDVIPSGEFTEDRLKKIDKVFVKTKAHRDLYKNIPEEKIAVIPNGLDPSHFENRNIKKNPYLIINTSSPDRHMDATLDIFEELIKRDTTNPWRLAWYYGWDVYDGVHSDDQEMIEWKKKQMDRFNRLVADGKAEGGYMIPHQDVADKYLEAGIFLYPTEFFEIHCISAAKAQAAGAYPITSDFAALNETVQFGTKIHTDAERWKTDRVFGDLKNKEKYLTAISGHINEDTTEMQIWAKDTYNWVNIGNQWNDHISGLFKNI